MAASVRDIAKEAGVSITTVSRALNSHPGISTKTRDRVLRTADRVGYSTRALKMTGMAIGFAQAGGGRLNSGYDSELVYGIQERLAREVSADLVMLDLADRAEGESYTQFCRRKRVRGLILRTTANDHEECRLIASEGIPTLVLAARFEPDDDVSFMVCESSEASRRAVEHLIHLGHRRIALVLHRQLDTDHADRERGYREALAASNIEIDPSLIIRLVPTLGGGANALSQLLSLPDPPTGVFFTDPRPTIGAMCRAHEVNLKVPEELSIIGFDDSQERKRMYPRITAVCQPTSEMGAEAANWMIGRFAGVSPPRIQKCLSSFLEINHTTGAPPPVPVRLMPSGQRIE
ncbi:MAG: LacI family DNA-binding transcriptional regulator [Planctomycetota bacterium]